MRKKKEKRGEREGSFSSRPSSYIKDSPQPKGDEKKKLESMNKKKLIRAAGCWESERGERGAFRPTDVHFL